MSTNVSKEKREQLVAKIKEIKSYIASAPQDENTARLLAYIADIEKDIKGKKYGLVFEEHREKIDEILEQNTPVLTEEKDLFIDNGGQMNFLIEGDNLAALQLLEKTHKGKIDLIYIDPPYNTGNKDFVYDDNFVDANDTFRHSKWLSFMQKRLEIAKRLLSENGVIFISIDDNEQSALKMLCDSVCGESNFLACFTWVRKKKGSFLSNKIRKMTEFVLCYQNAASNDIAFYGEHAYSDKWQPIVKRTNSSKLLCIPANVVSTKLMDGSYAAGWRGNHGTGLNFLSSIEVKNGVIVNELLVQGNFVWQQEFLDKELKNGTKIELSKQFGFNVFRYNQDNKFKAPSTLINETNGVGTNEDATKELQDIFNLHPDEVFSYSKPRTLLEYIVKMVSHEKISITILDFFAGSGTTGHAVMNLNAEDGGTRRFILCTNNENNICRDVTYERIKRVIERDKYEASLKYYKVDFVPISDKLYYEYADELLKHIRELVELENGINFNGNAEIAIVLTEKELDEFAANMSEKCKAIYLGHDVLPSEAQESLFKARGIAVNIIPDYYYRELEG